jgi:uncharacterized protein YqkB
MNNINNCACTKSIFKTQFENKNQAFINQYPKKLFSILYRDDDIYFLEGKLESIYNDIFQHLLFLCFVHMLMQFFIE